MPVKKYIFEYMDFETGEITNKTICAKSSGLALQILYSMCGVVRIRNINVCVDF